MTYDNIFSKIPKNLSEEIFETLISSPQCKIERIISKGHHSPKNFWYDQDENEWVIVIKGQAALRFEDDDKIIKMGPGDHINIPAHCKHRVEWTSLKSETIWLAVFY